MGYRDDNEALRARVESLEGELASAEGELARLRGERPGVDLPPVPGLFAGQPELVFDRTLPFELPETRTEDLVAALREHAGVLGRYETLGHTLEWRSQPDAGPRSLGTPDLALRVVTREGKTRVWLRQDLAARRKSARQGPGLWGLLFLTFMMLPLLSRGGGRGLLLLSVAVLPGIVAFTDVAFRRSLRRLRGRLAAILDAHARLPAARVRVDVPHEEGEVVEVPRGESRRDAER